MYFYRKKKNGSASIIRFKIRLYFLSFSHFCFFPPSLHNFGGRKRNKLMIRDHKHKQCCALHGFIADRRRTQRGGKEKTKADQPPLRSLAATDPSIYPPHRRACVSNNGCQNMYKVGSNKSLFFSSPSISTTCFIISWKRPATSAITAQRDSVNSLIKRTFFVF
jgi:hypothetical protein